MAMPMNRRHKRLLSQLPTDPLFSTTGVISVSVRLETAPTLQRNSYESEFNIIDDDMERRFPVFQPSALPIFPERYLTATPRIPENACAPPQCT